MRGAGLYSALLACRTKSTIINNQRTPTTTLSPSPGMEMKIEQTTTTSRWRWKKESQQAYIFGFIYSYADQRDATWWQRRPLLLTGENVNKKIRAQFHTLLVVWCRTECGPGFAVTVNDYKNVFVLNSIFHARNSTTTWWTSMTVLSIFLQNLGKVFVLVKTTNKWIIWSERVKIQPCIWQLWQLKSLYSISLADSAQRSSWTVIFIFFIWSLLSNSDLVEQNVSVCVDSATLILQALYWQLPQARSEALHSLLL